MKDTFRRLLLASCLVASASTFAQAAGADTSSEEGFGLGVAVLVRNEAYKGVGTKTYTAPLLTYQSDLLSVQGTQANLRVFGTQDLRITLLADYRSEGFKADDSAFLSGLADRTGTLLLGGGLQFASRYGVLGATLGRGVNASKGTRGELSYAYPIRTGALMIAPKIAAEVLDAKYVNHYFGVALGEATAFRPAYAGRRTVNLEVGVEAGYDIDRHHRLMAVAKHRKFGSAIADSPLLDKRSTSSAGVAYVYRF